MSASTNSAGPPLPARMVVEGEYLEKNWKKWRQLWEAYAAAAQLGKQDKAVQVGTLTLALGHDAIDLLNSQCHIYPGNKSELIHQGITTCMTSLISWPGAS